MPETRTETEIKQATSQVIRAYRIQLGWKGKPLSYVRFAFALSESVQHLGITVSHQAIKNWEDGFHRPGQFLVMQLASHTPEGSWQRTFAMDVLAVQWPELYQPGSEIGKALLSSNLQIK